MSNGHAWSDIKHYTLSEIGVFISSVYLKRDREKIDKFSLDWMSKNLTKEGMEQMIKSMTRTSSINKEKIKTKEDVAKDWIRLAAFQQKG